AHEIAALAADDIQNDLVRPRLMLLTKDRREMPQQVGVVSAGLSAVGRDDDVARPLDRTLLQHRVVRTARRRDGADHFAKLLRIRPGRLRSVLRTFQAGSSDHLHRLRDLLHVLSAFDLALNFAHSFSHASSPSFRAYAETEKPFLNFST